MVSRKCWHRKEKKQSKGQKVLFLIVDQGGRFDAMTLELKLESREMLSRRGSRCRGPEVGVDIVRAKIGSGGGMWSKRQGLCRA